MIFSFLRHSSAVGAVCMRAVKNVAVIAAALPFTLLLPVSCGCQRGKDDSKAHERLVERLVEITDGQPGRFGVAVITDSADTIVFNNSADYPLMSMFKLHEALAVCHALDIRGEGLDMIVDVPESELNRNTWSPMIDGYTGGTLKTTVGELLDWLLIHSDNNASNILFDRIVSVAGTDAYVRSLLPEDSFRLRWKESEMQEEHSRSYDNCSSPLSYASLVNRIFTMDIVSRDKQDAVIRAMRLCDTGLARITAGLPAEKGLSFAHRTGSGYVNSRGEVMAVNDGGHVHLPSGKSYSIAVLVRDFKGEQADAEKVIAKISGAVYDCLSSI